MASNPLRNSAEAVKVSMALQTIAGDLDATLAMVAGKPVSFSLFVWTEGRANYISTSNNRAEIKAAIQSIIDGWDAGMPDVPAHEVQG